MHVGKTVLGIAIYLAPDDALVAENVAALSESARKAREDGRLHMVIDLRGVPFLDSKGLEFLLDLSGELRESGGTLRIANGNAVCRDVLALTGIDQVIPVFESLESAGRSFL